MAQIDPTSAVIYQTIARLRRALIENPDMPAETLREALSLALDAAAELLQASDEALRALEEIAARLEAVGGLP